MSRSNTHASTFPGEGGGRQGDMVSTERGSIRAGMTLLVIGAVSQVFGRHLQSGGADVTFFVREKYRAEAERGFDLYPLNRWRLGRVPARFEGVDVVTTAREVAALEELSAAQPEPAGVPAR